MSIEIYSSRWCGYCTRAKMLLDNKDLRYIEIDVSQDRAKRTEMMTRSRRHTVPQIFIDGTHIGGCDELFALDRSGKLDEMLPQSSYN